MSFGLQVLNVSEIRLGEAFRNVVLEERGQVAEALLVEVDVIVLEPPGIVSHDACGYEVHAAGDGAYRFFAVALLSNELNILLVSKSLLVWL